MLKKLGIALVALFGLIVLLAGFYLYSDDEIVAKLSDVPTGGLEESAYLERSEIDGSSVLSYSLETTHGLVANQVVVSEGKAHGSSGVFVKSAVSAIPFLGDDKTLAIVDDSTFHNGVIEIELNGTVSPNVSRLTKLFARAFIGVCFRVSDDVEAFECFYLRPENGNADDEKRRMHAVQYTSAPDWDFARFRKEAPEKYENPANIQPGKWHNLRIEVEGVKAKLFIDNSDKPVLEVDDLKLGDKARGKIGLWVGPGTNGFFKNLKITRKD